MRKILRPFQDGSFWMDGQPAAALGGTGFAAGYTQSNFLYSVICILRALSVDAFKEFSYFW
ncbi:MAG TPA: hypothetical protein VGL91_15070, partial [Acidobacteriota bacterium]